ncbi:DUF5801 repeats-in-toxin domain-containing protein [Bradyrhizobium sp. USDA 3256]
MAVLTINGNLIIDEAASLQTSGTDNDTGVLAGPDNEVAWSYLLSNMSAALKTSLGITAGSTGEESGDTSVVFPQVAARTIGSASTDFIQLNTTTVTDLQFSDPSGNAIADGTATQIFATHNGAQIFLYADSNNNILLGREGTTSDGGQTWTASSTGAVAFAIVIDETLTSGKVSGGNIWTIQYEALKHTNTSGIDDADVLDLSGLVDVKASFTTTTTVNFGDFSHVPSGSDDWSAIEQTATAGTDTSDPDMLITGLAPGSKVTVSTQGLGNNSQALNPGEAVRIDVVNHVNYPDFPLTNPDVHDLTKLSYTSHVGSVTEASFSVTQVNPGNTNTTVKVHIYAFNETNNLQNGNLVSTTSIGSDGLTGNDQTLVPILGNTIKVYSDLAKTQLVTTGITITAAGDGSYFVDGLKKNYTVDFQVAESSHMDRFVVGNAQPTSGSGSNVSFDAGNFTFSVSNTTSGTEHAAVGGNLLFEDDGPTLLANGTATALQLDESYLAAGSTPNAANTTTSGSFSGLFTPNYGADAAGAVGGYTLGVKSANVDSGLIDSLSSQTVLLSVASADGSNFLKGDVLGKTSTGGDLVFTIHVDSTGTVTFHEFRAVHEATADTTSTQGTVGDSSEASATMTADLITLSATATDKDGDTSTAAAANIGNLFKLLDDGPSLSGVESLSGQDAQHPAVAFTAGSSGSDSFTSPDGADGAKVTIDAGAAITGLTQSYNADHTILTYKDSGGNGVYQLSVTDTGYTFTVLQTLANPPETLNFSAIKSGSPVETLNVSTSGGHNILFNGLFFNDGTFYANPSGALGLNQSTSDLNHANLGPTNPADDLNPDNIGFGVKNGQASQINMNEGFFFSESSGLNLKNLAFDVAGIGNISSIKAEYWLFNSAGDLIDYENPTISGLKQGNVHVTLADLGNTALPGTNHDAAGESFSTGYIRFYFDPADTNAGVRIINFTTQVAAPVNDQDVQFRVVNTDADGDTAKATFNVLVDNPDSTTVSHWPLA